MTTTMLRTLAALDFRDGELAADEAKALADAASDGGTVTADEQSFVRGVAADRRVTPEAAAVLVEVLNASKALPLRVVTGASPNTLDDDAVFVAADGSGRGSSAVTPYTRSYDAVSTGPLNRAHGSPVPASSVLSAPELSALRQLQPAQALDAMAAARGVALPQSFAATAQSPSSYDPSAPSWWGKCHAWAWSALSNELSARVDVGGAEGERGVWLEGQWLSRADLGNWLMGLADTISMSDSNVLFDTDVTAKDLLRASSQYLTNGGGGFVADIHLDAAHGGAREVWNQPFVSTDVDVSTVKGEGVRFVLSLSRDDGERAGVDVKLVRLRARYGNEVSDSHEGPWQSEFRRWNVYAVTDASGRVVSAYMADDVRLDGARGLPTRHSDERPEYIWRPSLDAAAAALEGRPHPAIDHDPSGAQFRFLVNEVLRRGVPGTMRRRFEAAVAALPPGPIEQATKEQLRRDFAGVSAAYTPEQWQRLAGARGLSADAMGLPAREVG